MTRVEVMDNLSIAVEGDTGEAHHPGATVPVELHDHEYAIVEAVRLHAASIGLPNANDFYIFRSGPYLIAAVWTDNHSDSPDPVHPGAIRQIETWPVWESPPSPRYLARRMRPAWEASAELLASIREGKRDRDLQDMERQEQAQDKAEWLAKQSPEDAWIARSSPYAPEED